MRYNNLEVNLSNYQQIFKKYPIDTLDEIRSALYDDLPIFKYIDRSPEDLHQIRLAMLVGVSKEFFKLPADILKKVRVQVSNGASLKAFRSYLGKGLDNTVLGHLLDWEIQGYLVEDLPLQYLTSETAPLYYNMLRRGKDISKYLTPSRVSGEELEYVMRLGKPELLNDLPQTNVLKYVCSHPNLLAYKLTSRTSLDLLETLQALYVSDLRKQDTETYKELTTHDEQGNFKYMSFQIDRVLEAFEQHFDYKKFCDPSLGISTLNTLLLEERFKKRKRLGGSL